MNGMNEGFDKEKRFQSRDSRTALKTQSKRKLNENSGGLKLIENNLFLMQRKYLNTFLTESI